MQQERGSILVKELIGKIRSRVMDIDRFKNWKIWSFAASGGFRIRIFVNKSRDRVCVWLACIDGGIL
jgi:hypothetical protein